MGADQEVGYEGGRVGLKPERFHDAIASLLAQVGLTGQFEIFPLRGGMNNRVFRIDLIGSQVCLKVYFQHPDDPRDRLGTEFSFCRFAWNKGVRALPQPLACDPQNSLALYEFIGGHQLQPGEVTRDVVQQALDFYRDLNRSRDDPEARDLPKASEACFSIAEHLRRVKYRLDRLLAVEESSSIHREAVRFVRKDAWGVWGKLVEWVQRQADQLQLPLEEEIPRSDWRLSPSDLGFHNGLLAVDGRFRFIDFEYAGWDDPDRLVCDFFCQPAVPVPFDYFDMFAHTVATELTEPATQLKRMGLLFPVYQVKWCCILLNDFLPPGSERRRFADGTSTQEERQAEQLAKARKVLRPLMKPNGDIRIEPRPSRVFQ